jgi:Uma2 family endonuclease
MIKGSAQVIEGSVTVDILTEAIVETSSARLPDLYEVVNGEIRELPPVGVEQVSIASRLVGFLTIFLFPRRPGRLVSEMLFHLADNRPERRPDVAYVSATRWPPRRKTPRTDAWSVVPELAVEVVSPTKTFGEIHGKIHEYFRAGVLLVWVVSTILEQVHVYTSPTERKILTRAELLRGDPVFPGFEPPLRDLFDDGDE